ncbi:MAG: ATP synthase F1 subunit gamma [Patescibacteria group bacterium]|nr:ATP synthase F1 subunit gamma [Patescibacteria group bacterium]
MASTIALKQRIKSVKGTRQITKAMQLVSASKMRRAQDSAFKSRAYRDVAYELLGRLNTVKEVAREPLFRVRPVKARLYIIITSNSGLAGAYNANTLKLLFRGIKADQDAGVTSRVIAIGSKGAQFVRRLSAVDLVAVYSALGDHPSANDIRPVLNTMIKAYKDETVDDVQIIYTNFKSNLIQEAQTIQLLPAKTAGIDENAAKPVALNFEPDVETVIEQVTTRLVEAQVWQAVLESLASEHSMRMLAMKNATDNAKDLIDDYTLELNTARQASITQELAEITGGAEALNG